MELEGQTEKEENGKQRDRGEVRGEKSGVRGRKRRRKEENGNEMGRRKERGEKGWNERVRRRKKRMESFWLSQGAVAAVTTAARGRTGSVCGQYPIAIRVFGSLRGIPPMNISPPVGAMSPVRTPSVVL